MEAWEERLVAYLTAQNDLAAAYIFGSRARGEPRPGSDADVAVVFAAPRAEDALGRAIRRGCMIDDLEGLLGMAVDVVDFDAVDPRLAAVILREGRVLLGADSDRRYAAAMRQMGFYHDRQPWYEEEHRSTLRFFGITPPGASLPAPGASGGGAP